MIYIKFRVIIYLQKVQGPNVIYIKLRGQNIIYRNIRGQNVILSKCNL